MFFRKTVSFAILFFILLTIFFPFLLTSPFHSERLYTLEKNIMINFEQNLSKLQPGDIAFKHPDIFPDYFPTVIDHCLLFVEFNSSTGLYLFIEAGMPHDQVQYRYVTEVALTGPFYGPFVKVKNANESQKQNAIDFAKRQIGKPFQGEWVNKNYNPEDTLNDSLANEWYCSELLWAAYYNCNNPFPEQEPETGYVYGEGIDLDRNGWNKNFILNNSIVAPREILRNRQEVSVFHLNPFKIKVQTNLEKIPSLIYDDLLFFSQNIGSYIRLRFGDF